LTQISRGLSEASRLEHQIRETREQARHTALVDLAKAEADAILRREEVTARSRASTCIQSAAWSKRPSH
jgi:hemolysin D